MKTLYLIIIGLLLNSISSYSQKEYYNWDYGGYNVITFDTFSGEPAVLTKSIMPIFYYSDYYNDKYCMLEGCSSISDSSGNFLFSTNGVTLYRYQNFNDSMKFYDGINLPIYKKMNGSFGSLQSSIIIKKPLSNSLYYIFTSNALEDKSPSYHYSIVDLSRNQGLGEIIKLNNFLYNPSTEKIAAIRHSNNTDFWIITHQHYTNNFVVYLLTENGIDTNKIITNSVGFEHIKYHDSRGTLKSNLKGDIIANIGNQSNNLDILEFQKNTGRIELLVSFSLNGLIEDPFSIEFSSDNSKLYISSINSKGIYQFDITSFDSNYIKRSFQRISSGIMFGAMQIAPNGKIYIASSSSYSSLAVINNPNQKGDSCNFSFKGTAFTSSGGHLGLPNFATGLFDFIVKIMADTICEGEDLILSAISTPDFTSNKFVWTAPNGTEYHGKSVTIPNAKPENSGFYKIIMDINGTIAYDTAYFEIYESPKAKIKGELLICKGETELSTELNENYKYKWSTGETTHSIIVKKEGEYHLTVENEFGCKSYDTVFVKYSDDLTFKFVGGDKLCSGDTLVLRTDLVGDDYIYEWSTGETTPEIMVTKGGKYILKVRTEAGCEGIDSIIIEEFEKPEVAFEKSHYRMCEGDSLTIKPIEVNTAHSYLWSDGNSEPERTFTDNAELYLIATSEFGCSDTAFLKIEFLEMPTATIIADKTEACFGEKITLKVDNYNPDFSYLWSNGQTAESITITESGIYKLFITNENLCSDTAEIEIKIHPDLALEILAEKTNLCYDDSTSIYSSVTYSDYLWSTGETTPTITTKEAGIYQLIANNEFGCADTAEIEIFKYDAVLELDSEKLIFDEICVGESQERRINLKLISGDNFRISSLKTNSQDFEINSSKEILKNGESAEITVIFKPQKAGIYDDEIMIESTVPCVFSKTIPISASSKQIIEFSIENHYAEAGQYLEIPLFADIKCPEPLNESLDYEITVEFDKEYFAADSLKYGEIISNQIIDNKRIIVIKANGNFNQNKSVVNVIYGNAFLGRTEVTDILIDDTKFFKTRYFPEYINGSLSVDGCVNDITTIRMFNPTKMTVSPNPTDGELKVSIGTQEQGSFSLVIFNVQGIEVFRSEFTKNDKTYLQKEFIINTQNMGNGIYTIHLTAPWTLLREQVVVVR